MPHAKAGIRSTSRTSARLEPVWPLSGSPHLRSRRSGGFLLERDGGRRRTGGDGNGEGGVNTIHKYPIAITDHQAIETTYGYKVLSVGHDPKGILCLWAMLDPEIPPILCGLNETTNKRIMDVYVVGTGNPFPHHAGLQFVGTVVEIPFVWHVFVSPDGRKPTVVADPGVKRNDPVLRECRE